MYLEHFGLAAAPFSLTANPDYLYAGRAAREALETLRFALDNGEGIVKITGEVGTGKTLLCQAFLREAAPGRAMLHLPSPALPPADLYRELGRQLHMVATQEPRMPLIPDLHRGLLVLAKAGLQAVLCLDEAQIMAAGSLEALRLLSNLEADDRKLMQIVLFGQPELDVRLDHPNLRQLKQRIAFDYRLRGLSRGELHGYVQHRLAMAGSSATLFSPAAMRLLAIGSRGVPRLVNLLCHKALMLAYGRRRQQAGWREMLGAIQDSAATFGLLPSHHGIWLRHLR